MVGKNTQYTTHKVPMPIVEALNSSQHFVICSALPLLYSSKFPREILIWMKSQIGYLLL